MQLNAMTDLKSGVTIRSKYGRTKRRIERVDAETGYVLVSDSVHPQSGCAALPIKAVEQYWTIIDSTVRN